jgi:hypothetical protein
MTETALEKIEKALTEITGPARANYHKLVRNLVERPDDPVDPALDVEKILASADKSFDELKADVTKLAKCHELTLKIAEAKKGIERCPELEKRANDTEREWERLRDEMVAKLDTKAREVLKLRYESHRLRINLQGYEGQLNQAIRFATPRSVRDSSGAPTDWKQIDLFASDEPPRSEENWKTPVRQGRVAWGDPVTNAELSGVRPRSKNNKH